jgi:hypothetical protein
MSARISGVEFELDNLPENDSDPAAVSAARVWKPLRRSNLPHRHPPPPPKKKKAPEL